ncbi:MAG: hypothetical protein EXS16_16595 [Gemmataceae bacterium]|nr:hypothetical protein [Gemmataceae bacterium]
MADKRKSLRPQLHEYKGGACAHCGKTIAEMKEEFIMFDGYFDFHHIDPKTKAKNYDNIIRRTRLSSEILEEVDKCVLLCSGRHKILHAQEISRTFWAWVRVRGRMFRQRMNGNGIYNHKHKTITFLSNEMPKIFPCWVAYKAASKPQEPKRLATFRAIEKRLMSIFKALRVGDAFGIWTYNGKLVAELSRTQDEGCVLKQLVIFPLIKAELYEDDGTPFFARNGIALLADGTTTSKAMITLTGLREETDSIRGTPYASPGDPWHVDDDVGLGNLPRQGCVRQ